jgi:hypothetical protein
VQSVRAGSGVQETAVEIILADGKVVRFKESDF